MLVVSTIKNQWDEEIVEQGIYLEKGFWRERLINCYNSSDLGLGTCLCQSHEPYKEYRIKRKEVLSYLEKYPEKAKDLTSEEKEDLKRYKEDVVYRFWCDIEEFFNMEKEEIEKSILSAVKLGLNVEDRLTKVIEELGYSDIKVTWAFSDGFNEFPFNITRENKTYPTLIIWYREDDGEIYDIFLELVTTERGLEATEETQSVQVNEEKSEDERKAERIIEELLNS